MEALGMIIDSNIENLNARIGNIGDTTLAEKYSAWVSTKESLEELKEKLVSFDNIESAVQLMKKQKSRMELIKEGAKDDTEIFTCDYIIRMWTNMINICEDNGDDNWYNWPISLSTM